MSDEYDPRHSTSTTEDREAFIPDDAEPFIDPDGPTPGYALFGNLYITDEAVFSTGVHCRRCGCGVARMDRETGVTSCPNCGWEGR
jgi:hypothetical protein